jgi:hypothetical protein
LRAPLRSAHVNLRVTCRRPARDSNARRAPVTFHDLGVAGIMRAARVAMSAGTNERATRSQVVLVGYMRQAEEPSRRLRARPVLASRRFSTGFRAVVGALGRAKKPIYPGTRWSNGGSNPGPLHCERSALPAELLPRETGAQHTPRALQVKPGRAKGRLEGGRRGPSPPQVV